MKNLKQLALPLTLAMLFAAAVPALAADPAPAPATQAANKYLLHIDGMT